MTRRTTIYCAVIAAMCATGLMPAAAGVSEESAQPQVTASQPAYSSELKKGASVEAETAPLPRGGPGARGGAGRRLGSGPGGPGAGMGRGRDGAPRHDGLWRGGEGGWPEDPTALEPHEVDAFLAFAKEHFPSLHDQLVRARQSDPRVFRQLLRRAGPPMARLMHLWREDPDEAARVIRLQRIEMELRQQAQRHHGLNDPQQRAAVEREMRELLTERFELRLAGLEREIDELRRRLDEQVERLAQQNQDKQRIIDEEFERILERKGWERGPRPRRSQMPPAD